MTCKCGSCDRCERERESRSERQSFRWQYDEEFKERQKKTGARWRLENKDRVVFHSLSAALRRKGIKPDENLEAVLEEYAKTKIVMEEMKMEKENIVEKAILNDLGRETVYELRNVRDRIKNKQVDLPSAQAEITASKHIIQVMALELKARELEGSPQEAINKINAISVANTQK